MTCHEATLSVGAYVLGALDPTDRADLEAHLHSCPDCRSEVQQLAGLPALLGRLTVDEAEAGIPELPEDGFLRLTARADQESRPRIRHGRTGRIGGFHGHWLVAAVIAILAVTGVGGGVAVWHTRQSTTASFAATSAGIRLTAKVRSQTQGTALDVTVSGLPAGEHCTLVAVSRSGATETAGQWQATYSGTAWVDGATTIPRDRLSELVLLGTTGQTLVTVRTPT